MNVEFESLKLLPKMFALVEKLNANLEQGLSKKWLSVKELSSYLTFGKDKIYKMVDIQFIENTHYYRKENRLLFDKQKIDEWIVNSNTDSLNLQDAKLIVDDVLSSLTNT